MREILVAVVTSLIASLIFWFIFDFIPSRSRYNKVRPKVEYDIYEIFINVSTFLGLALDINEYGWSFPRDKIESGNVTKADFELWLQNKCLNSSYQFDEMGPKLLPIGDKLKKSAEDICSKIERCATYYSFMTADEILLLRKISTKATIYSYDDAATTKLGSTTLRPVVPNITYMAENFAELSKLYIDLRQLVWSYKKIDRSINQYIVGDFSYNEAKNCYVRGEFKCCIKFIKKSKYVPDTTKQLLMFKAYYKLGKEAKAINSLKQYFDKATHKSLLLYDLLDDEHIDFYNISAWADEIISEHVSEIELYEAIEASVRSKTIQEQGIATAIEIEKFYKKKLEENSVQAKEWVSQKHQKIVAQLDQLRNDKE